MHTDLEELERELGAALEGLDARQTQLRPKNSDGKWSIHQIVDHLSMSYERTWVVMEERLSKGRPTLTKPSPGQRLGQFLVIRLGRFPAGREAPAAVRPGEPKTPRSGDELKDGIRKGLSRMHEVTVAAETRFGKGRCVSHIVLGPLAISQWRRFHLVHGRHHAKQILRIRQDHSI